MESEGELYYDNENLRWCINGYELHCGDCFEILQNEKWEGGRIEYNHSRKEFYTTPYIHLEQGLKVRFSLY